MDWFFILQAANLLVIFKETAGSGDTYNAVVVEYSPPIQPSVDPETNIMRNVRNYTQHIKTAKDSFKADIIVFPECALTGYDNQMHYVEVPDPSESVNPCLTNGILDSALVELSCAASKTKTYVVVNVDEKYYNASLQDTFHFNTDVVFDSNGTIIARYRKIHLFNEPDKTSSPDKQIVYFDTAFGVRFGIFTCFDIFFEVPGVILVNRLNITHFIFPTAWESQLPFFAATQIQQYWSYTHNVVLLAADYNSPKESSTGSGIYLGRCGPATYNMTETRETFMLHAEVPKKLRTEGCPPEVTRNFKRGATTSLSATVNAQNSKSKNSMKTNKEQLKFVDPDFYETYTTKLITLPAPSTEKLINITNFTVPFIVEETICINTFCCKFSLNITAVFNKTEKDTSRRDDYTQYFYRLAIFNGVQEYRPTVMAGVQNCAIVSCINTDVTSCGQSADNATAEPNRIGNFFQTGFIFNSISIVGSFSNNRTAVGPNVLLTGNGDNFGSLITPDKFTFDEEHPKNVNTSVLLTFQTVEAIKKLVTVSLYGRLFSRDFSTVL